MAGDKSVSTTRLQMEVDATGVSVGMKEAQNVTERTLTKMTAIQKEFGAQRSVQDGLLRNSQGQIIEGLKDWQIALGYTRDEYGRLNNAIGKNVDNLTVVQQKLGMYRDELGNVLNAQGNIVSESAEVIAARKAEADAIIKTEKALIASEEARRKELIAAERYKSEALEKYHLQADKSLRQFANTLQHSVTWLMVFSSGSSKAAQSTRSISAAVGSFATVADVIPKITKWYNSLTAATKGQTTAQIILNAVSGNWLTIVAGLAAAGATLAIVSQLERTTEEAKKSKEGIQEITGAIKELNDESRKSFGGKWGLKELEKVVIKPDERSKDISPKIIQEFRKDYDSQRRKITELEGRIYALTIAPKHYGLSDKQLSIEIEKNRSYINLARLKLEKNAESITEWAKDIVKNYRQELTPLQKISRNIFLIEESFNLGLFNENKKEFQQILVNMRKEQRDLFAKMQKEMFQKFTDSSKPFFRQFQGLDIRNIGELLTKNVMLAVTDKNRAGLNIFERELYDSIQEETRKRKELTDSIDILKSLYKENKITEEEYNRTLKEKNEKLKSQDKEKKETASKVENKAAERWSLEAYNIINRRTDNQTVRAVERQTKELAQEQRVNTDRLIAALPTSGGNIPVFNG